MRDLVCSLSLIPTNNQTKQGELTMAKNGNRKPGGGYGSAVNREVGVRNGARASVVNPRSVSQIGQSLGNKSATGSDKKVNPIETFYTGQKPTGGPGGVPLGNEIAAKGLGVGGGRNLWGQSGSQKTYGTSPAGLPRICDTRGQWPDTNTKPR
jgi:hypothetical protein